MVSRIILPLLISFLLTDIYIDYAFLRGCKKGLFWKRMALWLPTTGLIAYTVILSLLPDFIPENHTYVYAYFFVLGVFTAPKLVFALCSILGKGVQKFLLKSKRNFGNYVGGLFGVCVALSYIYGVTLGFSEVRVKHVELSFSDLPPSFDGYKIVHVSDIHIGTFDGWRKQILLAEMDSIAKQKADLILFTGDLQNIRPQEVERLYPLLQPTMDGAIAILGNHDYAEYVKAPLAELAAQEKRLQQLIRDSLKWQLLTNENLTIYAHRNSQKATENEVGRHDVDSIIICGEENDGEPPFPKKVDVAKTMRGVQKNAFVIMLQHDPSAWRRNILPQTNAQLTLSGHTHGGQMQFFGFRPTQLKYKEDYGLYEEKGRFLYITAGLGGLMPFRLNMPNEVTVITLKHKKK
ncbi:MAG: metallophosphoesterase [Prevotella sp.]|nr:metallophosphoesterase [Prevotellaceae bacterium]MDY3936071.1 metallophosphoesterase [Prevotella sp.]